MPFISVTMSCPAILLFVLCLIGNFLLDHVFTHPFGYHYVFFQFWLLTEKRWFWPEKVPKIPHLLQNICLEQKEKGEQILRSSFKTGKGHVEGAQPRVDWRRGLGWKHDPKPHAVCPTQVKLVSVQQIYNSVHDLRLMPAQNCSKGLTSESIFMCSSTKPVSIWKQPCFMTWLLSVQASCESSPRETSAWVDSVIRLRTAMLQTWILHQLSTRLSNRQETLQVSSRQDL